MGNLYKDADAVAGLPGGVFARAVFEPLHNGERVVHDRMRRRAVDADDRADTAGVVLIAFSV